MMKTFDTYRTRSIRFTGLQEVGPEADRPRVALVEEGDHQVPPLGEQDGERDEADDREEDGREDGDNGLHSLSWSLEGSNLRLLNSTNHQ